MFLWMVYSVVWVWLLSCSLVKILERWLWMVFFEMLSCSVMFWLEKFWVSSLRIIVLCLLRLVCFLLGSFLCLFWKLLRMFCVMFVLSSVLFVVICVIVLIRVFVLVFLRM